MHARQAGTRRPAVFAKEAAIMQPMRILIIEDDREAAAYLVKAFREAGHVADHAGDGQTGFALARDGNYDVLIVDRMLPKLRRPFAHRRLARAEDRHARC